MSRRFWLALLGLLLGCGGSRLPTAPRAPTPVAPPPVAVTLPSRILITAACTAVWDFQIDGTYRGLWLLSAGGRLTLAVDSLRAMHALQATRWEPAPPTVFTDSVATGAQYAVPCSP